MDWKKLETIARRGLRAARAIGNDVMAKVEKRVIDPTTELGMTLEKIAADRAAINSSAVVLHGQTILLQRQQQQLRDDMVTTNERIAALLRAGNREQATVLAGVLSRQQSELQLVGKRLWQAVLQAQEISTARNAALEALAAREREIQDMLAQAPATEAMRTISAALQSAQTVPADAGTALAAIDQLAALPASDVCPEAEAAAAEADADAIIRRFEATQALAEAEAGSPSSIKTMGKHKM